MPCLPVVSPCSTSFSSACLCAADLRDMAAGCIEGSLKGELQVRTGVSQAGGGAPQHVGMTAAF